MIVKPWWQRSPTIITEKRATILVGDKVGDIHTKIIGDYFNSQTQYSEGSVQYGW